MNANQPVVGICAGGASVLVVLITANALNGNLPHALSDRRSEALKGSFSGYRHAHNLLFPAQKIQLRSADVLKRCRCHRKGRAWFLLSQTEYFVYTEIWVQLKRSSVVRPKSAFWESYERRMSTNAARSLIWFCWMIHSAWTGEWRRQLALKSVTWNTDTAMTRLCRNAFCGWVVFGAKNVTTESY